MARVNRKRSDALCESRSPHVVATQRDARRLKCRSCGASERMGEGEMPARSEPLKQFAWVREFNAQVERFLAAHVHKEVSC